jgi:alternate signal-mediated exported protein
MKKTTKGAFAAGTAAVLLLGGVGTLAYWNDSETVTGTTVGSGKLDLELLACGDWVLDATGGDGGPLGTREIVPGDSLTKSCTYTLTAEGDHLEAALDVTEPEWSGDLADHVDTTATFTVGAASVAPGTPFPFEDGAPQTVTAAFTVDFPFGPGVDNTSQDVTATLDDVTLTVTQTNSH